MTTVGAKKQTRYYQLEPAAAIRTLKSHAMGLTNPEAGRRYDAQGANTIPYTGRPWWGSLAQAAGHPFVALPAVSALLASSLQQTVLVSLLLCVMLVNLALRYHAAYAAEAGDNLLALPGKTRVVRNGQTRSIKASRLAIGDIVVLGAGDIVPADMRLIEVDNFVTDESLLYGGAARGHKFTHALVSELPAASQHNMTWAATVVTQGTAKGVVVAIGGQTQLGRSRLLTQIAQSRRVQLADQTRVRYGFTAAAATLLLVVVWLAWRTGVSEVAATSALLVLVIALAPNQLLVFKTLLGWQTKRRLARGQIIGTGDAAAQLGNVHALVIDADALESTVVVRSFTVGRATYDAEQNGYEPSGNLTDSTGKRLTKKALTGLGLFFEACTLTSATTVLRGGNKRDVWQIKGDLQEAAALVLVRKAGLNTEYIRDKYAEKRFLPYDPDRELASSIRQYGNDTVVFVRGSAAAVLACSKKLWDHGHVRPLSAGDKAFFAKHGAGLAFGYRILPDGADVDALTMAEAEQNLTFLGFVETMPLNDLDDIVAAAQQASLRVAVCTGAPTSDIPTVTIADLSDEKLLSQATGAAITHFKTTQPEDTLRLITVLQAAGKQVGFIGASLMDAPARALADVRLYVGAPVASADSGSHISVAAPSYIATARSAGHKLYTRLRAADSTATVATSAATTLTLLGVLGLFYYHAPLAGTATLLLALQYVIQPLAARLVKASDTTAQQIVRGFALGLLAYIAYAVVFVWHAINPAYISSDNPVVLEAVTVSFVVISLGLVARFIAANEAQKMYTHVAWVAGSVIAVLAAGAYVPALQSALGTFGLGFADWLVCGFMLLCYIGFYVLQRHSNRHSWRAVVKLHHETFGKGAPLHL